MQQLALARLRRFAAVFVSCWIRCRCAASSVLVHQVLPEKEPAGMMDASMENEQDPVEWRCHFSGSLSQSLANLLVFLFLLLAFNGSLPQGAILGDADTMSALEASGYH